MIDAKIKNAGADFEAIAVPMEKDVSMIFVRRVEPVVGFLFKPETLLVLAVFARGLFRRRR